MISKRFRFRKLGEKEIAVLAGDFDSHVGINSKNYEDQHGGYGYGYFVLKDKKLLPSVEFITQHKLLVCDFKENKRHKEKNCTLEKDIEIT